MNINYSNQLKTVSFVVDGEEHTVSFANFFGRMIVGQLERIEQIEQDLHRQLLDLASTVEQASAAISSGAIVSSRGATQTTASKIDTLCAARAEALNSLGLMLKALPND